MSHTAAEAVRARSGAGGLPTGGPGWSVAVDMPKPSDRANGGRPFEKLLRSDPELLRSLIDQAADCVCLHEIDGRILDVNQSMCSTLGYTREELLELTVFDIDATATSDEAAAAAVDLAQAPGVPGVGERTLKRKDGSTIPVELRLSIVASGERQLMLGLTRDITDRKRAERAQEEAQRALEQRVRERTEHLELVNRRLGEEVLARQQSEQALRESEERFRALAERGHLLAWEADARSRRFTYVGPQAPARLGYAVEHWYRPEFWEERLHPDDREWVIEHFRRQSERLIDFELEYRMVASDGRPVWFQDVVHVTRDAMTAQRLRGFLIDITARKRAEEAQLLLLRELDHRVKNTLATVQAVADLSLRTASSLDGFGGVFRGRIAALARMHAAVWRHKGAALRMHELAELSLAPFALGADRVRLSGQEISIAPQIASAVGLVLHELATNAVKHGALSVVSGTVALSWHVENGQLNLTWRESGGPTVTPPRHRGFGSVLIEQSIPYELGGSVALEFVSTGVHCAMTVPLDGA